VLLKTQERVMKEDGNREEMCVLEHRVCTNEVVILREQAEDFSLVLQVYLIHGKAIEF
jgi:hypothetical protein